MRLFVIFEVEIRENDEPLFRQVHHFGQETGNGHAVKQSREWAKEYAKPDTLYLTAEVWDSGLEKRFGGVHSFTAYYWRATLDVAEVAPSEFGYPFHQPDSPQSEEEGRS